MAHKGVQPWQPGELVLITVMLMDKGQPCVKSALQAPHLPWLLWNYILNY